MSHGTHAFSFGGDLTTGKTYTHTQNTHTHAGLCEKSISGEAVVTTRGTIAEKVT